MKERLSYEDIGRMLPHKYPFLLLDAAFDIQPGESGRGIKSVTGVSFWNVIHRK